MKKLKKATAMLLSLTSVFSICCFNKAEAYFKGQKHTWRIYEKVAANSFISDYESYLKLSDAEKYTYVSNEKKDLLKGFYYMGGYDTEAETLYNMAVITEDDKILIDAGYLTVSKWRTPTEVNKFNATYSYKTNSGAVIAPIYIMAGDVNQDSYVNKLDSEMLAKYLAGSIKLNERQLLAADVNNNGKVDIQDAICIEEFNSGNRMYFD